MNEFIIGVLVSLAFTAWSIFCVAFGYSIGKDNKTKCEK